MLSPDTPIGSRIVHRESGRVCYGTLVGFWDGGQNHMTLMIPDVLVYGPMQHRPFAPCSSYLFYSRNCELVEELVKGKLNNIVLTRSLLLEKRFKEKQDAKKKKTVPIQNDESKRETIARIFEHYTVDFEYWENPNVTIRPPSQIGRVVNSQLGQLNGATWPFTTL